MIIQSFCQKISLSIIIVNDLKSENIIFNQFINEMMSDLNMCSSRVLNEIFRDVNGIGIVTIYDKMFLTNTIIKKKFLHPKELSVVTTCSYVFGLSSWERYKILFLTHPRNKIIPQVKTPTRCAFMIISITSPVGIKNT